jgi:hypothetical protein
MSLIDERFLTHRLRSTSAMGIVGASLAILLWYYRHIVDHRWNWDLFAVAMVMVAVKLGLMIWYRFHD